MFLNHNTDRILFSSYLPSVIELLVIYTKDLIYEKNLSVSENVLVFSELPGLPVDRDPGWVSPSSVWNPGTRVHTGKGSTSLTPRSGRPHVHQEGVRGGLLRERRQCRAPWHHKRAPGQGRLPCVPRLWVRQPAQLQPRKTTPAQTRSSLPSLRSPSCLTVRRFPRNAPREVPKPESV